LPAHSILRTWSRHATAPIFSILKQQPAPPQSYDFYFEQVQNRILVFGRLDARELARMQKQRLSLNQELNNLTRRLQMVSYQANQGMLVIDQLSGKKAMAWG